MSKRKKIEKKNKIIAISVISLFSLIILILFFKWLLFDRVVESVNLDLNSEDAINVVYKTNMYSYFDYLGEYDVSSLSNQEKLWFVVETDDLYDKTLNFYSEGSLVSAEDVIEFYKRYFGDSEIENEDILCPIDNKPIFEYNSKEGYYKYSYNSHLHGGISYIYDKYSYPISVEKIRKANGDILYEVKMNKMFGDYCTDICGITSNFYGTYEDSLNKENSLISSNEYEDWEDYFTSNEKVESLYNKIKDELPIYVYEFLYDNNNYYLISVKIKEN